MAFGPVFFIFSELEVYSITGNRLFNENDFSVYAREGFAFGGVRFYEDVFKREVLFFHEAKVRGGKLIRVSRGGNLVLRDESIRKWKTKSWGLRSCTIILQVVLFGSMNAKHRKCPDLKINGRYVEVKIPINDLHWRKINNIKLAHLQADEVIIGLHSAFSVQRLAEITRGRFLSHKILSCRIQNRRAIPLLQKRGPNKK